MGGIEAGGPLKEMKKGISDSDIPFSNLGKTTSLKLIVPERSSSDLLVSPQAYS